jgi:hypothetical protein
MGERRTRRAPGRAMLATAATLAVAFAAAVPAPALAAPAMGGWTGTWVMNDGEGPDYANAPLSFRVLDGSKKLVGLTSHRYPVFCPDEFPSFQVKSVEFPSASIKAGKLHQKYTIRQGGEKVGQLVLDGRLGAREGKGWLSYEDAGCYGTTHWRAWVR